MALSTVKEKEVAGNVARDRQNNFDLLRFVLATAVVFSHSFDLLGTAEPIRRLTHGFASSGMLAVDAFFVISGYLVTQSLVRHPLVMGFVAARVRRILPGLAVAVIFSALVVGPIATALSVREYIADARAYTYIIRNITILKQQDWRDPTCATCRADSDGVRQYRSASGGKAGMIDVARRISHPMTAVSFTAIVRVHCPSLWI